MFRELERKNKAISKDECIELLKTETRGVLSVLGEHDYPYGMPLNHYYDEKSGNIYFHVGIQNSHRTDSLKKHNKVSFCCYEKGCRKDGQWAYTVKSVIVFGTVSLIRDRDRIRDITTKLSYKFTTDTQYITKEIEGSIERTLLLELHPQHISGKVVIEA